jgi:hypothetical protein
MHANAVATSAERRIIGRTQVPLGDQQRGVIVDRPVGEQHAARHDPAPAARRMVGEKARPRAQRRLAFVHERERQTGVAHHLRYDRGVGAVADRHHVDRKRGAQRRKPGREFIERRDAQSRRLRAHPLEDRVSALARAGIDAEQHQRAGSSSTSI